MNQETLASQILPLMQAKKVPGLTIAVISNGEIAQILALGTRNVDVGEPVTTQTVFEAASLSKPLFSYAVLQLVDGGYIDLDKPLSNYGTPLVPDDPASLQITARHVLSHTTGLPNWRRDETPLRTYFKPGTRFSYSGEGFVYLQSTIEGITGESLDTLMTRLVFDPLEMRQSSYIWRDGFINNYAAPHDEARKTQNKFRPREANAAWSLHTTASDFARFLIAAQDGSGLREATAQQWFAPQVFVPQERFEALDAQNPAIDTGVAWSLGWGREPEENTYFHWGANPGAQAFALGSLAKRTAVVMFMNSEEGLSLVPDIIEHLMPGRHPSLKWLGLSKGC